MQKARLFTKDFMLDASISLCCSLNYFTLLINMVGFASVTFGATEAEAGLAAGLYVIGGLLSRIFLGKYIELVGRKRMLIIALAAALVMSCTYFFVSSLMMLYVIRMLHGLCYGLSSSCTGDIIAKILPAERRGEGLGYFYLSVTIATAIGPFLGMAFGRDGNYDMVFSVGLVMYSLALLLSLCPRRVVADLDERLMGLVCRVLYLYRGLADPEVARRLRHQHVGYGVVDALGHRAVENLYRRAFGYDRTGQYVEIVERRRRKCVVIRLGVERELHAERFTRRNEHRGIGLEGGLLVGQCRGCAQEGRCDGE